MRWTIPATLALAAVPAAAQRTAPAPQAASQFVTLGTLGGVRASPTRAQPANLLLRGDQAILIDVGDGTVQQLAKAGVPLGRISAVFLSHYHFDHIGGLSALLGTRFQTKVPRPLAIYGPPGTREIVHGLIAAMGPSARSGDGIPGTPRRSPTEIVTVKELGGADTVMLGDVVVRTAQNTHYSFKPGSPEDAALKSLSFRFEMPDRAIVYTGDTGPSAAVEELGKGADMLVSEMIDLDATLAQIARQGGGALPTGDANTHLREQHLTPEEVGRMAQAMGVKRLVLTHLVVGDAGPEALAADVATIRRTFTGTVTIAKDLDRF